MFEILSYISTDTGAEESITKMKARDFIEWFRKLLNQGAEVQGGYKCIVITLHGAKNATYYVKEVEE